jgi:glycosyltransferase involved in cell wall biosynthesis
VAWEGDFEALHSLAIVNRAMCRRLIDRGHDVRLIAAQPGSVIGPDDCVEPDARLRQRRLAVAGTSAAREGLSVFEAHVHVRHCWPPVLEPPARGKWVLMQPWEFGSLPKAWVPMLRQVDEVWAYSRFVRDCFLEAEVPRDNVHVVPLGVVPEVFRPGVQPLALQAGPEIRLLFVGGTIYRKGIDVLLAAVARGQRGTLSTIRQLEHDTNPKRQRRPPRDPRRTRASSTRRRLCSRPQWRIVRARPDARDRRWQCGLGCECQRTNADPR